MVRHIRPRGGPYTPELAGLICRRIADGEPLRTICGDKRVRGMPDRVSVYNWLNRYPEFMKTYRLARRAQAELYLDEVVDIADGPEALRTAQSGRDVARDRLRVETRFRLATVMAPKAPMEDIEDDRLAREPPDDDLALAARIAAIFDSARRRAEMAENGET